MSPHRVHLLLDRSGSMHAHRREIAEAINGFLAAIRADALAAQTTVSLTAFDGAGLEAIRQHQPAKWVRDLKPDELAPGIVTPARDALGHILDAEARISIAGNRAIVLVADGRQTASARGVAARIRASVERRRSEGWVFIYLGANQDAVVRAARTGIPKAQALGFRAHSGVAATAALAAAAGLTVAYFSSGSGDAIASPPAFAEADRQAAFDGAQDWQAAMEGDIASAPAEPAADSLDAPPLDADQKPMSVIADDNEPTALDSDAGSGIVEGIGSVLGSIFD